jgi:dipeptidyl aminopeptidase/acylaminoacyl peptidase
MKKNSLILSLLFILLVNSSLFSQEKKILDYTVYDSWKSLSSTKISNDGNWVSYGINPQVGDGFALLYNTETGVTDSVPRGKSASFSAGNSLWAVKVVAQADTIRQLKLKKVKKEKFPKDSLLVRNLKTGTERLFSLVNEYTIPADAGEYVVVKFDKSATPKDTTKTKSKEKELKDKKGEKEKKSTKKKGKIFKSKGVPLMIYTPATNDSTGYEKVLHYSVAKTGKEVFLTQSIGDTAEVSVVLRINPQKLTSDTLFKEKGSIVKLKSDYEGEQCTFLFSGDTAKTKIYRLYYCNEKMDSPTLVVDTIHPSLPDTWSALNKGSFYFSKSGDKLYFGAGVRPAPEPKDTLTEDEKTHVDIWSWHDKTIQPMQKKRLSKDKNRAYLCVYNIREKSVVQLESKEIPRVSTQQKGDLDIALGYDDSPYKRASSWNGKWCNDIYKIDIKTGVKELLKKQQCGTVSLSFNGEWFAYYEPADSNYYVTNIQDGTTVNLTKDLDVKLCDELNDIPNSPGSYGVAGWSMDEKSLLVYDRYDIWQLDLENKKAPLCLTKGEGRRKSIEFRYVKLDAEEKGIDTKESILLKGFNEVDKSSGFYSLKKEDMTKLIWGEYSAYSPQKAKDENTLIWRRSTFTQYPELEITDIFFSNSKTISVTNPQQSEYNWGKTQLVNWTASDGLKHQGIIVTPENLDTAKKYPMIVYYYERSSNRLNSYYSPKPSRSTVNWTFYASNGYVLFIPDIFYRTGEPGLCSYEAVVSGTLAMADKYSFIDINRVGLQGQSWGGYQTAFLVTRTNMYKAAMAGAPVSNMTSAYGGIRWGTGMSRMFQYEHTQSRIGGTLWDKTMKYIENSPVFFVPQIETPLLIMHNDNDGAVPWYQGIEYFMALRRLDKPAWMLVYNNEEHNLTRRANEKDLSRRMMQFFDHYLKGKPMPVWMKDGIPATEKGDKMGYEF